MQFNWSQRKRIIDLFTHAEQFAQESSQLQNIATAGWVKSVRQSKVCTFIMLNDGSTLNDFQLVVGNESAAAESLKDISMGCSLWAQGKLVLSQGQQKCEMQVDAMKILGTVAADYPLQKKATSLEFLREVSHVRARTNTISSVMRVRHELAQATHEFFSKRGFYYVHTPVITSSDCEGAGELFRVTTLDPGKKNKCDAQGKIDYGQDYFGQETFLAVSGQLEAESLAMALGSVYTFGPTFRSENSNTTRHLSEFWMIEPEVAFAQLNEVATLAADFIKHLITTALAKCSKELAFFEQHYKPDLIKNLTHVAESTFLRITYTEAVEILQKSAKKFEHIVAWGKDLQTEHERYLTDEHFKAPVIVTHYPKDIKAFYMRVEDDQKTVRAMDVLVPGVGEIIGGSEREERLEVLQARMKEMHLSEADYWWYLDLRRFGSVPHAGFGLGFERAIMYITGMTNIRDVIAFPRFPKHAKF